MTDHTVMTRFIFRGEPAADAFVARIEGDTDLNVVQAWRGKVNVYNQVGVHARMATQGEANTLERVADDMGAESCHAWREPR